MDLQPSGINKELITVKDENVLFVLKGPVGCNDTFKGNNFPLVKIVGLSANPNDIEANYEKNIYLNEYTNYEVVIESLKGEKVEFYHENINIRNKVSPITKTSKIITGVINFKGDVGYTDFTIRVNGKDEFKITMEVYPSKLTYKSDYLSLVRDVNEEIYNLAYGFLSRTYLGAEINNKQNTSRTEFYSILNYVFDKLEKSIDIVIRNHNHVLHIEKNIEKFQRIKKTNNDTVKYLEKRPYLLKNINGRHVPERALVSKKTITYDTKENRLIRFIIEKTIIKIDNFKKIYMKSYNEDSNWAKPDRVIISRLDGFKKILNQKINSSFIKDIKPEFTDACFSLVFAMGSGYREVYKYYIMLQKGLNIKSNIFNISIKDLSVLYEYWCFIKINSLLQKKYKLITCDMLKTNRDGIVVTLKKNKESSLTYENPKTGEQFIVSYNRTADSKTVSQKPDNILSLNKKGALKRYQFIFDAKYKIDTSSEYIKRNYTAGPKEEDINTMHRYRDAIVYSSQDVRNCVFGAFVLFPYDNEEEFKNNRFYKSIEEVNIGAMPFLPSTTGMVEKFLNDIIDESSYSNFERIVNNVVQNDYYSDQDFVNRNVLVGLVKDEEQYNLNKRFLFYHIPKKRLNLINKKIEYIALYKSKSNFGTDNCGISCYGIVKKIEEVKRSEIMEIPKDSDEIYYKFSIEKWIELKEPVKPVRTSIRDRIYTSLFLLKNAHEISELFIKSKQEYRLMMELGRFSRNIETSLANKNNEISIHAFKIDEYSIVIDQKYITNISIEDCPKISLEDFKTKPRESVKKLIPASY